MSGVKQRSVYKVQNMHGQAGAVDVVNVHKDCVHLLHRSLGHVSFSTISKILDVLGDSCKPQRCHLYLDCQVCKQTKAKACPIPERSFTKSTRPFEIIHADVVGNFPASISGNKYFLLLQMTTVVLTGFSL